MNAGMQETNWIPRSFQQSARNLAKEAVERFVRSNQIIGLGSGPMAAAIVREMTNFNGKETLECIPTSFQIKLEAQCSRLKLVDEDKMPQIDVVLDGADQVDAKFNMIKAGGGALLRKKILISAAKKVVIVADAPKFVQSFSRSV